MPAISLALHAMATRFELVLPEGNSAGLRAAGEEAMREIERLEERLSLFRAGSEIADLNTRAAHEPVRVTPELFSLLESARHLHAESRGAFDITIAPLVRCWGFMDGNGRVAPPEELAAARARVGMPLVELDSSERTVRFTRAGVMLDLGAIGKGYAVDRAVAVLREAGVASALIHGGTSTVYGLGHPPNSEVWTVAIENPQSRAGAGSQGDAPPLTKAPLRDQALSVSAVWGKCFERDGTILGHVIDPRTGEPVSGANLAAVVSPSATETDALSTALLVLGEDGLDRIAGLRPAMDALVVTECDGRFRVNGRGRFSRQAAHVA